MKRNIKAKTAFSTAGLASWLLILALSIVLIGIFYDGLAQMVKQWISSEEYGYGFLIPVISAYFIWQRKNELASVVAEGSWLGLVVTILGLGMFFLGELSTLYIIVQYAFVVVVTGVALSLLGWQRFKLVWVSFLILIFMIPLPGFIYKGLSAELQLISSQLGVAMIRLFNISVYLEGNIIDLGIFKLQVVEACSGLRYLFPLATLAFIAAYIYRGTVWRKVIIFLSSAPITVVMNSIRIGMIGILVEHWGRSAAEGFLHYFEGWVIFMICLLILLGEMWLLNRVGSGRRPFRDAFTINFPERPPSTESKARIWNANKPLLVSSFVILLGLAGSLLFGKRVEIVPPRTDFINFPMQIGDWHGKRDHLEKIYLDVLKLDDYLLADFVDRQNAPVNLYVAYYASQRKGDSAHSPRSCIPGGGWEIQKLTQTVIAGASANGAPLNVNRLIIQYGDRKQLVYYWFQERGRDITNEYLVKWYIFWDALTRNRTDGALVRLVTPVQPGHIEEADKYLRSFARAITPSLRDYIPD